MILEHTPEILSPSEGRTEDQPACSTAQCLPPAEFPGIHGLWPIQLLWKLLCEGRVRVETNPFVPLWFCHAVSHEWDKFQTWGQSKRKLPQESKFPTKRLPFRKKLSDVLD